MTKTRLALSCLLAVLGAGACRAEDAPWVIGVQQLYRLDLMPAFKRSVTIGAVTSYDRTEGNDDGFSGTYSFVRKEGDDLVLAELKGPGCIYRIHTPTPTDDPLEFFFDGESTPRIKTTFNRLYSGQDEPFVKPLVLSGAGGHTCYVPIPFKKSVKILLRAKSFQFYDLNYAIYPAGAPVKTFEPKVDDKMRSDLSRAKAVFNLDRSRSLAVWNTPAGTRTQSVAFEKALAPGKTVTLFETKKGGRIAGIRLTPAAALRGDDRGILIRITWDGTRKPAVLCPAGDFFGYAWGEPASGSIFLGTHDGENYCNLPMPFDKSAKIELVSTRSTGEPISVKGEVILGDTPRRSYEGKFYAVWRRENPTTEGKPFTYLETRGRGHVVGLALQAQGKETGHTGFFEGDDLTTVDGKLVVHGTGSEDSFNGGWYDVPGRWDRPWALPLSGCMLYRKDLGRTGGYRFFIGDAYSYRKSILQTIEHAPEKNQMPTDYCAVTYFYSEKPPTLPYTIPTAEQLRVSPPGSK